jgi:hypothetical protein
MTTVWLVTNGGDGSDGDEWLLHSVHVSEASAKAASAAEKWHREVEEWDLEGSILTDEEREAVKFFADIHSDDEPPHEYAATLLSLLKRLA